MNLGDLLDTLGTDQLRAEFLARDGITAVGEVVIHDPDEPLERGQLVLAAGLAAGDDTAADLVVRAADAGAAAVVLRDSGRSGPVAAARAHGVSLLRVRPGLRWVRLVELLETLLSATTSDPEAHSERLAPSSVHGLADAIAVMVGGSVVLYDRAHRVVAYSVQGYEIDSVRRDTILGRQTPEAWVDRFTTDQSAYQTFRHPGKVIRVDGYPGLRTRLRVAVRFDNEVLGEISVAEGHHRLGPEAEPALLRAAELAVPFLLRHRLVEDTDRAARARMLRGLMYGDAAPSAHVVAELRLGDRPGFAVAGFAPVGERPGAVRGLLGERVQHLLSLQMHGIDPDSAVVACDDAFYALLPVTDATAAGRLAARILPALRQLERIGVPMVAAAGPWVSGLAGLPRSRRSVDDLLTIVGRDQGRWAGRVATAAELWPDLVLLPVEEALAAAGGLVPCEPLRRLLDHDAAQRTGYVHTLTVYLEEFGSISGAAGRLVLHPNTLRHRLRRIGEISALDLADPAQRLAVAVQLRALAAGRPRQG